MSYSPIKKGELQDFPADPVTKTLGSQRRDFPGWETRFHMLQLKSPYVTTKDPECHKDWRSCAAK